MLQLSLAEQLYTIFRDPLAKTLLKLIIKQEQPLEPHELRSILNYAFKNKVLLLLLNGFPKLEPRLYMKLSNQRERFLCALKIAASVFVKERVKFVVFKTLRPVPDAPVDIDLLVPNRKCLLEAIAILRKHFKVEIWSTDVYSAGLRLPDIGEYIDIYFKPHVANFVYLNNNMILKNPRYFELDEVRIPLPSFEAEALSIVAHSIIKEQLVTLNDIISVAVLLEQGDFAIFIKLARSSHLLPAVKVFFESLTSPGFPHRISYKSLFKAMLSRVYDAETIESLPAFLCVLPSKVLHVPEHSKRETYLRGLNR
ncbi:MAG: hypothetical protein QXR45_13950 [Candidatus Bathyarchaeia archaeon]